ncbi:insulinase family protein [Cellulosilyticum ruminicola]|uniref:insulinase family protein n=1 Tax=Cellulosilyticum ruminicola TaxID=425254 RepID=UPI0006CF3B27|nr:insulinase family protein [Cellulosilyticum ruminicola]
MLKKLFVCMLAIVLITTNCYGQGLESKQIENTHAVSSFKEYAKEKHGEDILHSYIHEKSGLEVIWIENKDANKSFTLGVRTPTIDSTGVNHIIEHTLFTGSRKYPSSSLFFDASSSYPHIYMNALTTGDMTIFPFATPYMSCYEALLDIYLDSIFNPSFLKQPYGFYEESFNYNPEEGRIGGVVYNEMKGAYSNEERKIYRTIRQTIYKDTHYSHDSGGDPNEIPKLTYSQFVDTYRQYYYPGNMTIILYGDLPIEKMLSKIAVYVEDIEEAKEHIDLDIKELQIPDKTVCKVLNTGSKCALAKSFIMPRKLNVKEEVEMDLWINAYIGGNLSPMQQTLQKLGCQEVKILKDDDLPYIMYTLIIKNIPKEKVNVYNTVLDELLSQMAVTRNEMVEGDVLLEAKWQQMQGEEDEERGIFIPQTILDGLAHGKAQNQYYTRKEYLGKIKTINKEECMKLWQNTRVSTFVLMPGETKITDPLRITAVPKEEWTQIKAQMETWQRQKYVLEGVPLEEMMLTQNLELNDKQKEEYTLLTTRAHTEFARTQLYYETSHIKQEDLPYLFLYSYLLEESCKEQTPFKGVLRTNCLAVPREEGYTPYFKLTVVTDKEEKNHGGILENARDNLLSEENEWYQFKLKKLINNTKVASQSNVLGTLSNLGLGGEDSQKRYLYEQGYPFYEWCREKNSEKDLGWIEKIKEIDSSLYQTKGLIVAVTSPYKSGNKYVSSFKKMITSQNKIEMHNVQPAQYQFKTMPQTSFLNIETAVDYIYLQDTLDKNITGSDYVTCAYLAKNYLNPQIRIKLGAYGAGCNCQYPSTFNIYTYRDPDYSRSLEVIKGCGEFLEKNKISKEVLKISQTEALTRIHQQFRLLDKGLGQSDVLETQFLLGNKKNVIKDLQTQILNTKENDICQKARVFKGLLDWGTISIATQKLPQNVTNYKVYQFK